MKLALDPCMFRDMPLLQLPVLSPSSDTSGSGCRRGRASRPSSTTRASTTPRSGQAAVRYWRHAIQVTVGEGEVDVDELLFGLESFGFDGIVTTCVFALGAAGWGVEHIHA